MSWQMYKVIFRVCSPMHIGMGKVGNIQRVRPYVTGRVLWGALTMRLTRDAFQDIGPAVNSAQYRTIGDQVHQNLAFTYFYPGLMKENGFQTFFPWENESAFQYRFLSSYQGTALNYPSQSSAEGMLHEIEFISPNTIDTGENIYLIGYVFEKTGCALEWKSSLHRLQLGGERGYGWGKVELEKLDQPSSPTIFGRNTSVIHQDVARPRISLTYGDALLAHTMTQNICVVGGIEPFAGREWRSNEARHKYAGQYVAFNAVCHTPGSVVQQSSTFEIGDYGIWQYTDIM